MSLNCSTSDAFRPKIWCHIGKSQHLFKGVSFSVRLTGVLHPIVVLYDIKNEIDVCLRNVNVSPTLYLPELLLSIAFTATSIRDFDETKAIIKPAQD